jgi:hypothetical protein
MKLNLTINTYPNCISRTHTIKGDAYRIKELSHRPQKERVGEWHTLSDDAKKQLADILESVDVWNWQREYRPDHPVFDGSSWELKIESNGQKMSSSGSNAHPEQWREFVDTIYAIAPLENPSFDDFEIQQPKHTIDPHLVSEIFGQNKNETSSPNPDPQLDLDLDD